MRGTTLPKILRVARNVELRKLERQPDMLVLHYTGMDDVDHACDWLCRTESQVSCHYLIDEVGNITQMVDEELRAWHAGVSSWQGETDINSRSIGIEIHNPGHGPQYKGFPSSQMHAVIDLSKDVVRRWNIAPQFVLAHSDVAPGRKVDPGEKFDWRMLHAAGVGHWVEPAPMTAGPVLTTGETGSAVSELQTMLFTYGYGIEVTGTYDARTRAVVSAFQLHFRQAKVDGNADPSTMTTLRNLISAMARATA
jgi:N-acetylmuramoyl-L-alanine amidase